jgi:GNAT superfamily N-acetyltransferase
MLDTLVTTYLEMTDPAQFRPAFLDDTSALTIMPMGQVDLSFYKFLYRAVGDAWTWRDRLVMPEAQLVAELAQASVHVLYVEGVPAGYVELLPEGPDTEIAYFGLREGYIGRGLGKHLLSWGVERAWQQGARRVWLHTCNLDSPIALANYQKRGFVVYKTTEVPMPEHYL